MATGEDWTDHSGKAAYGASVICDVLIIVSESVAHPNSEVVQRRPARELTEEWREKLDNQGIAREHHQDELSIVKARFGLSQSRYTIAGVEVSHPGRQTLTSDMVLKKIRAVMNNCENTRGGNTCTVEL